MIVWFLTGTGWGRTVTPGGRPMTASSNSSAKESDAVDDHGEIDRLAAVAALATRRSRDTR